MKLGTLILDTMKVILKTRGILNLSGVDCGGHFPKWPPTSKIGQYLNRKSHFQSLIIDIYLANCTKYVLWTPWGTFWKIYYILHFYTVATIFQYGCHPAILGPKCKWQKSFHFQSLNVDIFGIWCLAVMVDTMKNIFKKINDILSFSLVVVLFQDGRHQLIAATMGITEVVFYPSLIILPQYMYAIQSWC